RDFHVTGVQTCALPIFTYDNPNRPDLGSFKEWSTSPEGLYNTFPPCVYRLMKVWGSGENEICTLNHHYGKQEKLPYMGVPARGQIGRAACREKRRVPAA